MSSSPFTETNRHRSIAAIAASIATVSLAVLSYSSSSSSNNKTASVPTVPRETYETRNLNSVSSDSGLSTPEDQQKYGTFHQSGFGGLQNRGHRTGEKAYRRSLEGEDEYGPPAVIIPVSAVPHAVPSLTEHNINNFHGHYVHDEHRSPFASFLYNRTKEEREAEQVEYTVKMNAVREEWGAWDFGEEYTEIRPLANFDKTPYKDMKNADFPTNSWQTDEKYTRRFIEEGKKLVTRVKEGVYAEYGHATKDLTTPEEIAARDELFQVVISEAAPPARTSGVSWITPKGFDALVKKLLHGMKTNDEFYYVMGGHSAAAGHGNNFHQQYTMQFANIMEPIFHKLGMRLIAKNLAMGGYGTSHYAFGSSTLYGETDIIMWDSAMTEHDGGIMDLFWKQASIGGERVPILIDGGGSTFNNLEEETGNNLWAGGRLQGEGIMPTATSMEHVLTLPFATRYQVCDANAKDVCNLEKYHDFCWVTRADYNPTQRLAGKVQGQASWHPGDRSHQFNSRKMILLFLKAFDAALDKWVTGMDAEGFPLKESHWHVGDDYVNLQTTLAASMSGPGLNETECYKFASRAAGSLEKACTMTVSGMTEFTPVNRGHYNSIHYHVQRASNGYSPADSYPVPNYEGINVLPLEWKIPEGEIDLHAIAIASTYAPPHFENPCDEDDDTEEAEDSRRVLRAKAKVDASINTVDHGLTKVQPLSRNLLTYDDVVKPGIGWELALIDTDGYCDGSQMSACKRNGPCPLAGTNDGRSTLNGNGLSGWLVINIPRVKLGYIFAKLQWWWPRNMAFTKDWTEVNNGIELQGGSRNLKAPPIDWPEDIEVDIAVNGKIVRTFNYTEFKPMATEIAYNEAFYLLLDDESVVAGDKYEEIKLGLRIRSQIGAGLASFGVTHIYYA